MSRVSMVVALGHDNVIGGENGMLWHLPDDLQHFKRVTLGHPVIMGRKTWDSLPEKARPLPGRTNIVITRDHSYTLPGAHVAHSFEEALAFAKTCEGAEEICVIGGGEIFRLALPYTDRVYLTLVDDETPGTVHFPDYGDFIVVVSEEAHEENGYRYIWKTLERA